MRPVFEAIQRSVRSLLPVLVLCVMLGIWQLIAGADTSHYVVIPPPSAILTRMFADAGGLLISDIPVTLIETLIGLLLALALGVGFAALLDYSEPIKRAIYPLLVISQTIPIIALAPLLILAFGFGIEIKIMVVVLFCFFPISVAMIDGLASTDPDYVALLRAMGAGRAQVWRIVRFPASLPGLFSGLRIAATYSVTGAILGEFITSDHGLGHYLRIAFGQGNTAQGFVAIVFTALLSIALVVIVNALEHLALPWYFTRARIEQWTEPGIF
jgi:ABC-type nitrate/sulfonate/bicarbonate transport system permease component